MALKIIERTDAGQVTAINPDQVTYVRQDNYGTSVHFSSGEHIISPLEFDELLSLIASGQPEVLLMTRPQPA